jgi:quercetin dioxygenase-like cupin family protein
MAEPAPPRRTVVKLHEALIRDEPANGLRLQELVTAAEHGTDVSVTWVHIAGRHHRLKSARSSRIYVLLSGVLTAQVGDKPAERMCAGDVALVPRDTPYELAGTATYLVINAPAFVPGDDEYEGVAEL